MNFYEFSALNNQGEQVDLSEYKGNVVLVVNTATKCGLTPQYEALQGLYDKYAGQGLVVLDFPCNQFLEQAPGTDEEISEFCTLNYSTTFPRFAKIAVNGEHAHPLYTWLKQQKPEDRTDDTTKEFEAKVRAFTADNAPEDIKWNFGKFLIDRNGEVFERYSPTISPEQLAEDIERLL